jgi:hypothetical protein
MTTDTRLDDLQQQLDTLLLFRPETAEQWSHVCWLEKEIIKERELEAFEQGQFGVGA